jgi:hypothetical protein
MTIKIEEGQILNVPLNADLVSVGVIARIDRKKNSRRKPYIVFAYFFGPYKKVPIEFERLKADDAVLRLMCSILYIYNGKWQIIGNMPNWNRDEWPLPIFYRDDLLRGTVLIRYDDNLEEIDEIPYFGGDVALTDRQSVAGSLAVEIMLRQKLSIGES